MAAILDFNTWLLRNTWRHKSRATLIKLQKILINFKTNN